MSIEVYNKDWTKFERYIEQKIKGRCELNNKNWLKLRDYHFEGFIVKVPRPYGFLFKMIHMSKVHKKIPCIHRVYHKYRKIREKELGDRLRVKSKAYAYMRYR